MSEGGQADTRGGANGKYTLGGGPVERVGPAEQGERGLIVRPPPGAGIAGSRELYRESKDVTEEAAATLRNISTNFLSSLKYKKVMADDGIENMKKKYSRCPAVREK